MSSYLMLAIAIVLEIAATSSLKAADGFSRLLPSAIVVVGYAGSFYLMTLILKQLPLGLIYATWAGLGTAGTVIVGILLYNDPMGLWRGIGIGLVITGVIILNAAGSGAH
jgi:multidrug transporter EmrE-like cation transporter